METIQELLVQVIMI